MGLLDIFGFGSNNLDRANRMVGEAKGRRSQNRQLLDTTISQLQDEADELDEESQRSVEQRFGDVIEDTSDRIKSNVGTRQNLLSRSIAATGGDITGQAATAMNEAAEGGNQQLASMATDLSVSNEKISAQRQRSANRLLGNISDIGLQQSRMSNRNLSQARGIRRDIKRSRGQFFADIIGAGTQIASAGMK